MVVAITGLTPLSSPSFSSSSCFGTSLVCLKPLFIPPKFALSLSKFKPLWRRHQSRKSKNGSCRAEFSRDAPFAVAIGASVLSSFLLPKADSTDEDGDSAISATDARFTVMGIVSFIPYFNWLSWIFAWLDSGKRRYAVYSLVYLAPYLRSNMSLSPEESWLPIASIVIGIIHVQLEAGIRSGDLQGFQLFGEIEKLSSSIREKRDTNFEGSQGASGEGRNEHWNLPPAEEKSRDEISQWEVHGESSEHHEHSNGDQDDDRKRSQ